MPDDTVEHVHKCWDCGTEWQHLRARGVSALAYNELHNCPKCGTNQRWIYKYVDETEVYPGEFEDRHQRLNRRKPGGNVDDEERKEIREEQFYKSFEEVFSDIFRMVMRL